jgi:predicted metal-dependent enzyme (double-stranded beta helix superfamily)
MPFNLQKLVASCAAAAKTVDAQAKIEALLGEAVQDAESMKQALSGFTQTGRLEDMVVHRDQHLTLLAGRLPPGFSAAPHNHNLWSVVAVYEGQEDNVFFERVGDGLKETKRASVVAPGVLANAKDAIHAICNPRSSNLYALHAYGGDLLNTPRSNWNPDTHEEQQYDWSKVARN